MGKASRSRAARQVANEIKREMELKVKAQKKKKTIAGIITVAACFVVAAAITAGLLLHNSRVNSGYYLRQEKEAVKTENLSISAATFTYFLNYQYQSFLNNNADSLASYGIDPTISPREQEAPDGSDGTFFDYIVGITRKNLEEIFALAERAKKEGVTLGAEEEKQIATFFETIKKGAENSKISEQEYIDAVYGKGINKDDIEQGLRLSILASKYYDTFIDSLNYTQEQKDKFFEENKNDFLAVNYKTYTFTPNITSEMTAEQEQTAIKEAEACANKLSKAKNPEEFDAILTQILKDNGMSDDNIKKALESTVVEEALFDEEFSVAKWAFGEDAKVNGTQIYKSNNRFGVYMLTKLPYKNEGETRTVRHILISLDSHTDTEAKKEAERILAEFNKTDKSSEKFAEFAQKYSEDAGTATYGGLYENFGKGITVKEFEDWSFDANRKKGDTGIVKTSHGYHIMYFENVGEVVWKANLVMAMNDYNYENLLKEIKEKYPITIKTEVLEEIPLIKIQTESSVQ